MTTRALTFRCPYAPDWFDTGDALWPVLAGEIVADGELVRGWFFGPVAIPLPTVQNGAMPQDGTVPLQGTLVFLGDAEVRVEGLFLSIVEAALDMFRHEFTSDRATAEATGRYVPPLVVPVPLELADLKRLCGSGKDMAAGAGAIRFTAEGGFRVDNSAGDSC
jgi:hypothetical protein